MLFHCSWRKSFCLTFSINVLNALVSRCSQLPPGLSQCDQVFDDGKPMLSTTTYLFKSFLTFDEKTIMAMPSTKPDKKSPVYTLGESPEPNPTNKESKPNITKPYAPIFNIGPYFIGFLASIAKYMPINPYTPHETLKRYITSGSSGIEPTPNNKMNFSKTDQGNAMNGIETKHPIAAIHSVTFKLFIVFSSF